MRAARSTPYIIRYQGAATCKLGVDLLERERIIDGRKQETPVVKNWIREGWFVAGGVIQATVIIEQVVRHLALLNICYVE